MTTHSEQRYYCVVIIDHDDPRLAGVNRDRILARTMGEALDTYAPDPAPGARYIVQYEGRARMAADER